MRCGSHLLALVVGVVQKGRQMADERALEGAVEYGLLVVDKDAHTGSLKGIDDAGAVVDYLVVDIGVGRVTAAQTLALGGLEKGEEQLHGLLVGKEPELVGVLYIHYFIADVVGSLDEVDQWVAGIAYDAAGEVGQAFETEGVGYVEVGGALGLEKAEFGFAHCGIGAVGIFDNGGQGGVGHDEASRTPAIEVVGEQAKGVGIAVKTCHVEPFGLGEAFAVRGDELMQTCSAPLAEVGAYGPLARVAKGRIAHVVGQTGGTDDGPHAGDLGVGQCGVAGYELAADIGASERPTLDTSRLWVRRLCTNTLPGSGNTCVLFCMRRKAAENIRRS